MRATKNTKIIPKIILSSKLSNLQKKSQAVANPHSPAAVRTKKAAREQPVLIGLRFAAPSPSSPEPDHNYSVASRLNRGGELWAEVLSFGWSAFRFRSFWRFGCLASCISSERKL